MAFLSLFLLQTILSCNPCNCPGKRAYLIDYESVGVSLIDPQTGAPLNVGEEYQFSDMTILTRIQYQATRYAHSSLGFSSAWACDCVFPKDFTTVDPISLIRISKVDSEGTEDISHLFGLDENFDWGLFVETNLSEQNSIDQVWLYFDVLPSVELTGTFSLKVEVELESGAVITDVTEQITFI